MNRLHKIWTSKALGRRMDTIIFGSKGMRLLAFPPRMGKAGDYEFKGVVEAMSEPIERGMVQLVCFDSVDDESFYCVSKTPRERIERHMQFEQYVLEELVPFTLQVNPNPMMGTFGCSLGAYHALNIAFRHPQRFQRVYAFSGRYDLTTSPPDFWNLFDGYYDDDIFYHTPSHYLPGMPEGPQLDAIRRLDITMTIGNEDPFFDNTMALCAVMDRKEIPHRIFTWDGRAHRYHYWRKMVELYVG